MVNRKISFIILCLALLISGFISRKLKEVDLTEKLSFLSMKMPVLRKIMFYQAIKEHLMTIVAFYDYEDLARPDIALIAEFVKAQEELYEKEKLDVFFGYYNDELDSNMEERYFLHSHTLPKIKVFYKGEALTYNGGNKASHIKSWIKRILRDTTPKAMQINSFEQLESITKNIDMLAVFVGDTTGENYKIYLDAMKSYSSSALFTQSNNDEVIDKLLNKTNSYTSGEETRDDLTFDEIFLINSEILSTNEGIKRYYHNNSMFIKNEIISSLRNMKEFKILTLTQEITNAHNDHKENWIFMIERDFGVKEKLFNDFCQSIAKKTKCYFLDKNKDDTKHIHETIFGITLNKKPQVFMIKPQRNDFNPKKFKIEFFVKNFDLEDFYYKVLDDTYPVYLKSGKREILSTLKDKIFNAQLDSLTNTLLNYDDNEDVLLYVYSSSCHHCDKFNPIYEQVGNILRERYPNVKIRLSTIDGVENDIPGFSIRGFPAFLIYQKGQGLPKTKYIETDAPRTNANDVISWMKQTFPAWRDADLEDL